MSKIALFGGSFDPVHLGHQTCVQYLVESMNFDNVVIIPTNQNPLKQEVKPAQKEDRLKMIEIAFSDFQEEISIDESELDTQGPSFSIDTIMRYREKTNPEDLFFVMGLDAFAEFDKWMEFEKIIQECNLIVVSRPPYRRPLGVEDLPKGLIPEVSSYERGYALFNSGRTLEFVNIKSDDISSAVVRKKLKAGKGVSYALNISVERFIKENNVYPRLTQGHIDFYELSQFVGRILTERAMNCRGYDLTNDDKLYDYTIIASATSTKQAQSLAELVKDEVNEEYGLTPFGVEGREDGRWVILDYGALIVHVFYDYVRHEYHLEQLWQNAGKIEFQ